MEDKKIASSICTSSIFFFLKLDIMASRMFTYFCSKKYTDSYKGFSPYQTDHIKKNSNYKYKCMTKVEDAHNEITLSQRSFFGVHEGINNTSWIGPVLVGYL